jgi:hypothetical protein
MLDGFTDDYKKKLVEKASVPKKKGFVYLNVGKKMAGAMAKMNNPEARKVFLHA